MTTKQTPPWKRARPPGPRTKLSEHDKERARRRAARAGRRYPNLIDNMWAAQTAKAGTEASATPRVPRAKPTKRAAKTRTPPRAKPTKRAAKTSATPRPTPRTKRARG